jgi:hypothetical protein
MHREILHSVLRTPFRMTLRAISKRNTIQSHKHNLRNLWMNLNNKKPNTTNGVRLVWWAILDLNQ